MRLLSFSCIVESPSDERFLRTLLSSHGPVPCIIVVIHLSPLTSTYNLSAKSRLLKAREEKLKLLACFENAATPSGLDGWYDNADCPRFPFCSIATKYEAYSAYAQTIIAGSSAQAPLQDRRPKGAASTELTEAHDCSKLRESAIVLLPDALTLLPLCSQRQGVLPVARLHQDGAPR